jgi:RNA polymerase sigma-70 factor (ECF subfamily)
VETIDPELIRRVQARDLSALDAYLVACRRPLLAFIDRELGTALRRKVEVDDIFQELSVEAVRSLAETDLGDRDPFGWLCQIAERRIIDAHRRFFGAQKRDAGRELSLGTPGGGDTQHAAIIDLLVASMTTPTQALSRKGHEIRLLEALASLPQDQRDALRLRYVEGLPSKEIAQRLGKSDGSVRVMLTRALSRLQQILGPDDAPR